MITGIFPGRKHRRSRVRECACRGLVDGGVGGIGVVESLNIPVSYRVAINGTERPVDGLEHYRIHPKIYLLTERGMTEQGRDKFFARMLSGRRRSNVSRKISLAGILMSNGTSCGLSGSSRCGNVRNALGPGFIFPGDIIFPVENQRNWLEESC